MKCALEVKDALIVNIEALIHNFYILGDGIVKRIERCEENT